MTRLEVRVFGKLRLQYGETYLDAFPTRRVEELFSFLLLYPCQRHTREKLIDILWPDASLHNGRASLSTALWRLRNVFDQIGVPAESILHTNRESVTFQPEDNLCSDFSAFERHLDEAAALADDQGRRERLLRDAVALYNGAFCDGIYTDWCLLVRERLERRYLWALGRLMAGLIQREVYDEATTLGEEILRLDPLREEAHRAMMLCYWKQGWRERGVRQFQQLAHLLQSELHILPMPETIGLYRQIIDDRLGQMALNGREPTPYQRQLQTAYDSVLSAADSLNKLLDAERE
jgi:DNA-binding SARP family transcriptional activator